MKKYLLPKYVVSFIDNYFKLHIKEHLVPTPYYINSFGFLKKPLFAGKGSPKEIENFVNLYIDQNRTHSVEEIRQWMIEMNIGIDCSGFIYNIFDHWLKQNSLELKDFLPKVSILNIRKFFSKKIKPQNSVSANEFTSHPLAYPIINLKEIMPGDLIRTKGGRHILLVTEVVKDINEVIKISFVHSTKEYNHNGVRKGEIILDETQSLLKAKWLDIPKEKINYTYKGFREINNKNGIYRLNIPILKH